MTKMQNAATEAIQNLRIAEEHSEIIDALARMAAVIGAQYFQIIPVYRNVDIELERFLSFGNYPALLNDNYLSEINAIKDPCIKVAMNNNCVIIWRKAFLDAKTITEREFITNIRKSGIKDGLTLPIYGPKGCMAVLSFACCDFIDLCEGDDELLLLSAVMAYQKVRHFLMRECQSKKPIQLSEREIECLNWLIEGKTSWEIGVLMGISARTVQFHLANCQLKLGTSNRIQTVVKAVVNNIIKPRNDSDFSYVEETKGLSAASLGLADFKNSLYDSADEIFEFDIPLLGMKGACAI